MTNEKLMLKYVLQVLMQSHLERHRLCCSAMTNLSPLVMLGGAVKQQPTWRPTLSMAVMYKKSANVQYFLVGQHVGLQIPVEVRRKWIPDLYSVWSLAKIAGSSAAGPRCFSHSFLCDVGGIIVGVTRRNLCMHYCL